MKQKTLLFLSLVSAFVAFFVAPALSYAAFPMIGSISPASGPTGTTLTISGANFSTTASSNTVTFSGGVTTTAISSSTTSLTVVVPAGAQSGGVSVSITNQGTSGSMNFSVAAPTLSSLSPSSIAAGGSLTITGSGFSTTPANNTVAFASGAGTVTGTVTAASVTSLTVTVPASTVTGPVTVTVGGLSSTASTLTIPGTPSITSISPTGALAGTTGIVITGTNFSPVAANNTITFVNGGVTTTPTAASATQLTFDVPLGAKTGDITVTVNGVTSFGGAFGIIGAGATITSVSPTTIAVGGTLTITGVGFSATPSSNSVSIGGQTASVLSANSTTITAVVPANAVIGTNQATLVSLSGGSGIPDNTLTITIAGTPTIGATGISPSSAGVGQTITITGTNFSATPSNNVVTFGGGVTATPTAATSTELTVTLPSGALSGSITVTSMGNPSARSAQMVTVLPAPTIDATGVSPTWGIAGSATITVTGSGFNTLATNNTVNFPGNVSAIALSATTTSLQVVMPIGALTGNVTVTTNGVTSATSVQAITVTGTVPTLNEWGMILLVLLLLARATRQRLQREHSVATRRQSR